MRPFEAGLVSLVFLTNWSGPLRAEPQSTAPVLHAKIVDSEGSHLAFRLGSGFLIDGEVDGAAASLDLKFGQAPVAVSLFVERFRSEGETRYMAGGNVLVVGSLEQSWYVGFGGGLERRENGYASRTTRLLDVVLGGRGAFSAEVGSYIELKLFIADPGGWSSSSYPYDFDDWPEFVLSAFDNDLSLVAGFMFFL